MPNIPSGDAERRSRLVQRLRVGGPTYADFPGYIAGLLRIKKAYALANAAAGRLDGARCASIIRACEEMDSAPVLDALVDADPLLDDLLNAAIAERAMQEPGVPDMDPDRHVGLYQRGGEIVAAADALFIHEELGRVLAALPGLEEALAAKGEAFREVIRMGRETLRDALPISLGRVFSGYGAAVRRVRFRLAEEQSRWDGCPLGAALGKEDAAFRERLIAELSTLCGRLLRPQPETTHIAETLMAHAHLEAVGLVTGRIARDLILMTSGPQCGLGDVRIPATQPGSSIMPGKVNPVIPDMLAHIGHRVSANHAGLAFAACGLGLEGGCDASVIRRNFHESAEMLAKGIPLFVSKVIKGIEPGPSLDAEALRCAWRPSYTALRRLLGKRAVERVFRRANEGASYVDALGEEGAEGFLFFDALEEALSGRNASTAGDAASTESPR